MPSLSFMVGEVCHFIIIIILKCHCLGFSDGLSRLTVYALLNYPEERYDQGMQCLLMALVLYFYNIKTLMQVMVWRLYGGV